MFLDIRQAMLWLGQNIEPWTEVIEKWSLTFEARRKFDTTNLQQFLKEWAPLNDINKAECVCLVKNCRVL